MFRKLMIALAAVTFVGTMVAASTADAQMRGGMRGFGGMGFRGASFGGFRGGMGFRGAGFGGFRGAGFARPGFAGAGFARPGFARAGFFRPGFAGRPFFRPGFARAGFVRPGFGFRRAFFPRRAFFVRRPFFHRRFFGPAFVGATLVGAGFGYGYGYGDSCWIPRWTPFGWRYVYVCGYPYDYY